MGELKSGKWILLISIYFFAYFFIVFALVNASNSVDTEITLDYQDPGFADFSDPFDNDGFCTGAPDAVVCSGLKNAFSNESCERVPGCNWIEFTNSTGQCIGTPSFNGVPLSFCTPSMNYTYCHSVGCVWNIHTSQTSNSIESDDAVDISTITKTVALMSGYTPELEMDFLGVPSIIRKIFGFFFFWLPLTMLTIAIFFALPFAH